MEQQISFRGTESRSYAERIPALRCPLPAVCILLLAATALRLTAQQAEQGLKAQYLGASKSGEAGSALPPLPVHPLAVIATPPTPAIISFNPAEVGINPASAQQLTASFAVSGYTGSFTPTATLHYGHDYTIGAVSCTPSGASETCNVTVSFQPSLPGARKDAIFLLDGTTRLATVLLGGVGQAPFSLLQPGSFSTSIPTTDDLYQSVVDENGVVYILPSGNENYVESVTKAGVANQIPLVNPPYFWSIGIDGAGVLYIFNESSTVTTYDTVQGIQGVYQIPSEPLGPDSFNDWYPGALGVDGSVYVVDQIRNNGAAYALKPDGSTAYAVTLDPGVLQPSTAAVDSAGNFFAGGYEINKISPAGVQTQVNTVGASDGLAVDAADTLYATRYKPTGGVAELPASNYSTAIASIDTESSPLGMSLGSDGTVYVSNYVNLDIFNRLTNETVNFGEVDPGKSSTVSTASVYNGGNQPLTISGFALSGASFSLDPNASNECSSGTVLVPGSLCEASVVFAPAHPGSFSGTISVTSNSLNGADTAQRIQLAGISYGSYDVLSPNPLLFASQTPGTSNILPVTLTNQGNSYASTISSVSTDNPAFTIAQGSCAGVAVQVGASCQLQVTFSPTAAQAYTGTATVVTGVSGTSQPSQTIALPLSGSGVNAKTATTTNLTSSANPSLVGQAVTLTATVAAASGPTPTGNVVFSHSGQTYATVALSNGVATYTTSTLTAATGHPILATYTGSATDASSVSRQLTQAVLIPTTTTLASSANPALLGQSITFTAKVAATSGATPTGNVVFTHSGVNTTVAVSNGVATLTISNLTAATAHPIIAAYSGAGLDAASSVKLSQAVLIPTTTTLKSSLNPSTSGQSVTLTAIVAATSGATPTGTVTFLNGTTKLGTGTLSNGTATLTTTTLPKGTLSLTASYPTTGVDDTSTSSVLTQTVNP